MRKFNDKEKEIIKSINTSYEKSGTKYSLFNVFYCEGISLGAYYSDGEFVVDKKDEEKLPLIEMKIMDVYSLLSFLERNGYILLEDCSLLTSACNIPNFIENSIKCSLSKECGEFIEKTRSRKLFITTKFIELVSNDFKTYEEIQLEEAQEQTKIASESLEEARKQTTSANASLEEARKQTNAAFESLTEAQKQTQKAHDSFNEAQKQTNLSIWAVILSGIAIIVSIIVPRCTSSKLDQKQFDTIQNNQAELIIKLNEIKISQIDNDSLIKKLNELKISQIDNDSLIKELNLLNQSIDEISNTLNEIKESKSKRK